jgi:hypothetical protein
MSFRPHWLVIHHTQGNDTDSPAKVREILDDRNLKGYHWVQYRELPGFRYRMASMYRGDASGEHVWHHNSEAVGYSFLGSFQDKAPDIERLRAAAVDCAVLLRLYGLTPADMIAHRDVQDNSTDCPGVLFTPELFEKFRVMVAEQYQAGA